MFEYYQRLGIYLQIRQKIGWVEITSDDSDNENDLH